MHSSIEHISVASDFSFLYESIVWHSEPYRRFDLTSNSDILFFDYKDIFSISYDVDSFLKSTFHSIYAPSE